ncbi:rhodanese-like domain-containing protein [Umezakia ovalisporum]|uniref:Rhodanese-like domain-containing protein n=1 Tax=Umezakia ovalisporum FSS-62 TaxID=2971776 RepID=A0AA43GWS6_9CYAN|nr:rhodanese-like domain-containing protein [Umezakia ovalisporum]MDH6062657.1 rhodanese-like domain-containing protein [Umezakia ovalisporum FSS-62]
MIPHQKLQLIDAVTLKNWTEKQKVHLIDVREPSEYTAEHIPGAKLLPLSEFRPEQVPFQPHTKVVLYCQAGNRSHQAAQKLINAGFADFTQLEGGITAWKKLNYATNFNKNAPISLMRQVQILAGLLVFTATILGAFVSCWFLILSGFVGVGLIFAGVTNTCAMARLLARLPYNQHVR